MRRRLALSVRQPWAWAIVAGHKLVENRTWATPHRGPLLIHASTHLDRRGIEALEDAGIEVPEQLVRGAVIGRVRLVDVVRDTDSAWAIRGHYHWLFADPVQFARPIPHRGYIYLFEIEGRRS